MRIRVTFASGQLLVLDSARVANDSLVGYRRSGRRGSIETLAPIALRHVIKLEDEATNTRGDVGFRFAIAGIVLSIGTLAVLLIGLAR
jgi:hypothetical protein